MKKILSIFLFLFLNSLLAQQNFSCGTVSSAKSTTQSKQATPPVIDPNKKYVLNVVFHLIFDNAGNSNTTANATNFGLEQVQEAVKVLNVAYNQHNIYFKYYGYDVTKNTTLTNNPSTSNSGLHNYDAINIYFKNNSCNASGCGTQGNTVCAIAFGTAVDPTNFNFALVHEVGHCLNLLHTFQTDGIGGCEHVTRNPADPNYNANIAGDFVTDTAAQQLASNFEFNGCNWIYNTSKVDCQNTPYANIANGNYLSYTSTAPTNCLHLTSGQAKRIKEHLENPGLPHWTQTYNTVESLYEPYAQTVVPGDIVSTTNQPGGVLVCRKTVYKRSFQKGFAYYFSNTEPVNGINVSTNTHFIYNDRTDHSIGVKIPQISNTVTINTDILSNVSANMCNFEAYTSGKVSTTPNLGSSSIKVTNLDAIQLQDPALYDKLESKNYHIIDKNTSNGTKTQTVIYKQ